MELALQYNIMYDVNPEHFGWNRQPEEPTMSYIKRVSILTFEIHIVSYPNLNFLF